jgi:hypothetical protein
MFTWVPYYLKALFGAAIAGLSSIQATLQIGHLSTLSYISAAIAALIAFGGISSIPNKPNGK